MILGYQYTMAFQEESPNTPLVTKMRSAIRLDPFPPHPGSIAILHQQIFAKDRLWAAESTPPTLEFITTYCSETTGAWSIKNTIGICSIYSSSSFRAVFHPTNRVLCMERWCRIGPQSTAVQLQQLDCLKGDHKKNAVPTKRGQHVKIPDTTKNKHNKHVC